MFIPSTSYAQSNLIQSNEEYCKTQEPFDYNIALNVLTIGEIDTKDGSYELIFALLITSDKVDFTKCPPPSEWLFTNGYIKERWAAHTEPHFHRVFMHGVFFNQLDYRDYPFETIDLFLDMSAYYPLTSENVKFTVNEELSGDKLAAEHLSGYNVGDVQLKISEYKRPYATFPHVSMIIPLTMDPEMIFLKKIFPVLILAGFGYSTFFMSPKILQDRITLLGAVFVGAIFFHAVLLGEIPPLGYLTIADKVMITVYSVFSLTLISILVQQRYLNKIGHSDKDFTLSIAKEIDKKLIKLTPIIAIIIFSALFFS